MSSLFLSKAPWQGPTKAAMGLVVCVRTDGGQQDSTCPFLPQGNQGGTNEDNQHQGPLKSGLTVPY